MRLEGERHDARRPEAFSSATARSTALASGAVDLRPKSRLTLVDSPAGPRSVYRAIASANVGGGLGMGIGLAEAVCVAAVDWQAETATARTSNATPGFTGR